MKRKKKIGFSLAEVLVILLIVGVAIASGTKLLTKRNSSVGIDDSVLNCIVNNASDISFNATTGNITSYPSSGACYVAYNGCKDNREEICNTLFFYADGAGDANQTLASLKILRATCDQGGEKACNYFISRCADNETNCTSPDSKYTLRYYTNLATSESNLGRAFIQARAEEYYNWNMTVFNSEIDAVCPNCPGTSTACAVNGKTQCPGPPDPACGAETIGSIRISKCNNDYNVVANNVDPGGDGCWVGSNALCTVPGCGRNVCNYGGAAKACTTLNGGVDYGSKNWRLPTINEMAQWKIDPGSASNIIDSTKALLDMCDSSSSYSPRCGNVTPACTGSYSSRCIPYAMWSGDSNGAGGYYGTYLTNNVWYTPGGVTDITAAFSVRCVRNS